VTDVDILIAVDALDDLMHSAPAVPLTDQVRVKPDELHDRVSDVLDHLSPEQRERANAAGLVEELEALVQTAKPVPLTGQVRVDKDRMYELLDRLRGLLYP